MSIRAVMPIRAAAPTAGAVLAVALLAACSNTEAPAAKGPHNGTGTATMRNGLQTIDVRAGNDYRFHPSTLVVHRGKVRVVLHNTAPNGAPHNVQVMDLPGGFVPAAAAGQVTQATFIAPAPGRYEFVCTFHVRQGQTGTLVVERGDP